MKVARFVLKIVAAALALAAAVCCVIAFWDKILEVFYCVKAKFCKAGLCCCDDMCDESFDWDEE